MSDVVERLQARFESGNTVSVERAYVTATEFWEIEQLRAERDALKARIDGAVTEHVSLDERGYTVILPPIEWECGTRVALVPLD